MAESKQFSYEGLFAKNAPMARAGGGGAAKRGKYDFAVAYPDPDSIPFEGLMDGLKQGLAEEGRDLALYAPPMGYEPLREFIADKMARDRDIHVTVDDIVLGDGSGQPIHMLLEVLVDPGDVLLTDDFVYSGTLSQMRRFKGDIRGVATDQEGMLPDALESTIQQAISEGKKTQTDISDPDIPEPAGLDDASAATTGGAERLAKVRRANYGGRLLRRPALRRRGCDLLPCAGRHQQRYVCWVVLQDHRSRHEVGLPDGSS